MSEISSYDDLVYGSDGESPMRPSLERAFNQAATDEQRLRIEIRTRPEGVPGTRQEHSFTLEPDPQHIDAALRVICQRLTDSPGEMFSGELRINFTASGSSSIRYGSFTRTIRPHGSLRSASHGNSHLDELLDDSDGDGDNSLGELDRGGLSPQILAALRSGSRPGAYDPQMAQLLETTWGFLFRSQAQQMAMFERTISMVETFSMRFGMPHPHERGIVDDKASAGPGGVAGLLPMLLNAAGHMAGANGPAEAAERAGSLAAGTPPPNGATRQLAIQGAGRLMQNLPRSWSSGSHEDDDGPAIPLGAGWRGPDNDDDGGDSEHFGLDHYRGPSNDNDGMPDVNGMSSDQMIQTLREWVAADPVNRKGEIRNRMGELAELIS